MLIWISKIELGRTHMQLEEVLKLRRGSVITLDKLAGDPVDILSMVAWLRVVKCWCSTIIFAFALPAIGLGRH